MLVLTRLRPPEGEGQAFAAAAADLLRLLAAAPGYLRGHVGRAADDTHLWVLATEWEGVGAYRRALSSYDVKMTAPAVMAFAVHEPSAFEVLTTAEPAQPV